MNLDRRELYKDANKMAMDYGKSSIQFAFYLNGAAATALFAKSQAIFVYPAVFFACGAALAILCMGFSYLVQLALAETWKEEGPQYALSLGLKTVWLTMANIETGRLISILLWVGAMVLFGVGAYKTYSAANGLL